jgi:hypothetical protein
MKIQMDAEQEVTEAKHDFVVEDPDAMEHHPHHLIVQSLERV